MKKFTKIIKAIADYINSVIDGLAFIYIITHDEELLEEMDFVEGGRDK